MSRPRHIDHAVVKRARAEAGNVATLAELRECLSVLLPALLNATLEQTASLLGVSRASVPRLQTAFRKRRSKSAGASARNWGGRRKSLLSKNEETAFLKPWLQRAASGHVVVVSPIRAAFVQRLGKPVKPSVVYRLLARHGWRKVVPGTRSPKSRPEEQEAWKKNCQKCWKPS